MGNPKIIHHNILPYFLDRIWYHTPTAGWSPVSIKKKISSTPQPSKRSSEIIVLYIRPNAMLRRTNARRQQSASESTDEKHGAWAQDRDVGGVGGIPPPSPSLSVVSGSDDHQPDYLLANTATGKHVHTTTTTTGGGGGGGGGPHHHHQYKRMPSYTLNRNAVWCGGRKSLSSQSSSSCITIQELRQRNAAPVGGVGGGGGAGRRRRCCRRLLLATSIALCAFLVWEIGGSLRAIYAMERRWSAEDAGGGRGVDGGGEGPLGSRSAAVPRRGPPLVPGMVSFRRRRSSSSARYGGWCACGAGFGLLFDFFHISPRVRFIRFPADPPPPPPPARNVFFSRSDISRV